MDYSLDFSIISISKSLSKSWEVDGLEECKDITNEEMESLQKLLSVIEGKSDVKKASYFKINDWSQSGLDKQSYVDTGTLISFPTSVIDGKKPIGELTPDDKQRLLEFLTKES